MLTIKEKNTNNMKMKMMIKVLAIGLLVINVTQLKAQDTTPEAAAKYTQVITERSNKIVAALGITDSVKYKRVLNVIVDQYRSINDIHNDRNAKAKQIKEQAGDNKAAANKQTQELDTAVQVQLNKLHINYVSKLSADLNASQVEKVKDLMTYNILTVTYKAYVDEIPTLTDAQKAQIKTWLIEARELAIDAESSEKKHAVFGKYKGRINNYLSAQGYDMKKEGEDWQKRLKGTPSGK
jgi:hypothetical protein